MPIAPLSHKARQKKPRDMRPNANVRGYNSKWQRARYYYLLAHPLCVECEKRGVTETATVVDHIIPHRGDKDLFWDSKNNWQSLCRMHHNRKTGKGE